jgi:GMP synthase (glutamine-hydrolysing)
MGQGMRSVLMIGHMPGCKDRRTTELLTAKHCSITSICPAAGDAIPRDLTRFDALVVLGGPQNVADASDPQHAFLKEEMRTIEAFLRMERPLLGICLGSQLLAATLGAEVGEHPEGFAEIGYYPVRPTQAGSHLMPDPLQVYQWHYQGSALPHGAELLARGDIFPNQAFRYGETAYGLQFHPDTTPEEIKEWTLLYEEQLSSPGAHPRSRQIEEIGSFNSTLYEWFSGFLEHWLQPSRDLSSLRQSLGATSR